MACVVATGCTKKPDEPERGARDYRSPVEKFVGEERAPGPSNYVGEQTAESSIDTSIGLTFHGYACTQDCSGHEAGYAWAEENGIADADDCSGNSGSFIEGCQAYAEEIAEAEQGDSEE